jgi:predicted AAA+ superfamily ATPase
MSLAALLHDQNPWWRDVTARRAIRFPHRRQMQTQVLAQLLRTDRRAAVVVGPRQVGKTVLLSQLVDDLLEQAKLPAANVAYFDFSDDRLTERLSPRDVVAYEPDGLDHEHPRVFLLDEIGSAARWSDWLKQAVDTTSYRIVVTDSAATLLRAGGRESGLGRWDEFRLEGLSFREFLAMQATPGESPEHVARRLPSPFKRYLVWGGYPEHVFNDLRDEVRRRIRTDIVERAIFRDLLRFDIDLQRVRDLFVYLVEDSGAIFDPSIRARDLSRPSADPADKRSIGKWLDLLEETYLVERLEPFGTKPAVRLSGKSRPKIYATDHGLVTAFAPVPDPLTDADTYSRALEAMVFRHLRELAGQKQARLSYFRSTGKGDELEVDFILDGPEGRIAIEVTSSVEPRREKVARFTKAIEHLQPKRAVLLYGGFEERSERGLLFVPAESFMLDPARWVLGA